MTCYLSKGSKDIARVKIVQAALQKKGYYKGFKIDGIYGPYTEKAVKQFQKAKGLIVDGCIGCQTWPVLVGSSCPFIEKPKVKSKVNTSTIYKQGKDALGGDFSSITNIVNLLKKKGVTWTGYQNDRYSFAGELQRFKNHLPANCSDLSQFVYMLAKALNKYTVLNFVHLICASEEGHVILEAQGGEFSSRTWIDVSAMLKSGYKMGSGWCYKGVDKPTGYIHSRNDPWLLSDDGIT